MGKKKKQTKPKDRRIVFSSQKSACKGRQLVHSADSLCSHSSPLASALLLFKNPAEGKAGGSVLTEKKTPEGEIKSDPAELILLWTGSQMSYLLWVLYFFQSLQGHPRWQTERLWWGLLAQPSPSRFTRKTWRHSCLSPRSWLSPFAQEQQPFFISPDHQPGCFVWIAVRCDKSKRQFRSLVVLFSGRKNFLPGHQLCSGACKGKCFLKYGFICHSNNELRLLFLGQTIEIIKMLLASESFILGPLKPNS